MIEPLRGTRIGRQELAAEILEDVPGALWEYCWIDDRRALEPPTFFRSKVLGMDPADGTDQGAEQGVAVVGIGSDWDLYVTRSDGLRVSGLEYCKHCINVAVEEECSRIVLEANHGGTYLVELLEQAMRLVDKRVAVRIVKAHRDKRARAEPVAAIYEQRKVRHLGHFAALEEQMTSFTGASREASPDRLDALVWAITDVKGSNWHGPLDDAGSAVIPWNLGALDDAGGAVVPWNPGANYGDPSAWTTGMDHRRPAAAPTHWGDVERTRNPPQTPQVPPPFLAVTVTYVRRLRAKDSPAGQPQR